MMASLVDVRRRAREASPELRTALVLSVLLLAYSNGTSVFEHDERERFLLWSNLAVFGVLLAWALWQTRYSLLDLGLQPANAPGSAMYGLVLSVLASVPPVAFITLAPLFNGGAVENPEITERSGGEMAYSLLFRQPIGTALFEEFTFRGALYAAWLRAGGERAAFLGTSAVFALWHVVITTRTVAESDVVSQPVTIALGVAVALFFLFIGGLIFAYLRWHTQSIAAPFMAHWLIVAMMSAAVWTMA